MAVLLQHLFKINAFCHGSAAIVEINRGSFKFAPILIGSWYAIADDVNSTHGIVVCCITLWCNIMI